MFIIEGSDSLGKTTVARNIVASMHKDGRYPAWYCHMTRPPGFFNFGTDYLDLMSWYAVQDRFHLGALAYHGPRTLPARRRKWLEGEILRRASMILVFVAVDRDWYRAKLEKERSNREEMFDIDVLMAANERYIEMIDIHNEEDTVYFDEVFVVGPEGRSDGSHYPTKKNAAVWAGYWTNRLEAAQLKGDLPWRD